MKVMRLSVAGLRTFEQAQFEFDPAFTLLVGVNGVGKTTILEALRIALSRSLPQFTASKSRPDNFATDDIRVGDPALTVSIDFAHRGVGYRWLLHKQREQSVANKPGVVREQTRDTPNRKSLTPAPGKLATLPGLIAVQPIAVYFATRRSQPSDEQPKLGKASGGQAGAYADALLARPLRLAYIAEWMLAQARLSSELPRAVPHLHIFRAVAQRLLPGCEDLRAEPRAGGKPHLFVSKGGTKLDVRLLSDGERGLLALGLDLAQRLIQANPEMAHPARDGEAVVLIDELELHLHPQWQRQIVQLLTGTFPNCQFIVTTHSPQIISETQPERILLLQIENDRIVPRRCGQAYGTRYQCRA